ncbi:hypothetical protein Lser_V15G40824 [Lactuca serriola]
MQTTIKSQKCELFHYTKQFIEQKGRDEQKDRTGPNRTGTGNRLRLKSRTEPARRFYRFPVPTGSCRVFKYWNRSLKNSIIRFRFLPVLPVFAGSTGSGSYRFPVPKIHKNNVPVPARPVPSGSGSDAGSGSGTGSGWFLGPYAHPYKKRSPTSLRIKLAFGIGSALLLIVLIFIIYCIRKSSTSSCVALFKHQTEDDKSVETFVIQYGSLSTKRYTYADIKKMTNSFQVKLGQGGFGTVFKGKLSDGRLVALKLLNSSKASGREFINEVASIGRTSHVNIVTLLGFCFDNQKRALIYEFMPNGSLEKFKYGHHLELHGVLTNRGCNTRILHLDIKPHNILLDEDFCPKIADFGLAKLYSRKDSIVSMLEARGTIGYIAPEVFNRNFGGVSHKSDVYSYGMLILEMVGGRNNVYNGVGSGDTSEIMYFPNWIYSRLKTNEFLFDGVTSSTENEYVRKMTIVSLWCIQTNPKKRPSINEVIEMLEGSIEALEIPPKPFFSSPPRSPTTVFNISQEVTDEHSCISQRT